jgi:hypothetical protein
MRESNISPINQRHLNCVRNHACQCCSNGGCRQGAACAFGPAPKQTNSERRRQPGGPVFAQKTKRTQPASHDIARGLGSLQQNPLRLGFIESRTFSSKISLESIASIDSCILPPPGSPVQKRFRTTRQCYNMGPLRDIRPVGSTTVSPRKVVWCGTNRSGDRTAF